MQHKATEYALDQLLKHEEVQDVAAANCLDNFTTYYAGFVFDWIMDKLDLSKNDTPDCDWFNSLCAEATVTYKGNGKDTFTYILKDKSDTIRTICKTAYEKLRA